MTKKTARRGRDSEQVNPVGRPRITFDDLDPNWREINLQGHRNVSIKRDSLAFPRRQEPPFAFPQ
jgi:hypothetical protein